MFNKINKANLTNNQFKLKINLNLIKMKNQRIIIYYIRFKNNKNNQIMNLIQKVFQ